MQRLRAHSSASRSVKWITEGVHRSSEKWWMGDYLSFIREQKDSEPVALKLLMKVRQFRHCAKALYLLSVDPLTFSAWSPCCLSQLHSSSLSLSCSLLLFTLARPSEGEEEEHEVCMGFGSYLHLSLAPLRNLPELIFSPVGEHSHTKCKQRGNTHAKIKWLLLLRPVSREHRPAPNKTDLTGMPESHLWNGFVIMSNHC